MSHGLLKQDTMFYVGSTPWHGMGNPLDSLATAQEAIAAANLGWKVEQEAVITREGIELPGKFITVRSDTRQPLGVVGAQYKILQNDEAFTFFDRVTQDPHGPKYETAGSLWNGRKIWALAKMPEYFEVTKDDVVAPYILLSNSHDGSSAVKMQLTPIRVVCQNTLNMAEASKGKGIKVRHSGDISLKIDKAQDALGLIRKSFDETFEVYKALANVEPSEDQVKQVMERLFPDTKSARAELQRDRVLELAQVGIGNAPVAGTAWALYNGVTELVDHHANLGSKREDANDMRLNAAVFGSGYDRKADALQVIAEVCLN